MQQARGARDRHGRRHGAGAQPAARLASSSRWPGRSSTPTCRPATCRSIQGDTFIAGAKILRHYGIGPLPGVAMMVVLVSRAGYCTITTRYDRAADHRPEAVRPVPAGRLRRGARARRRRPARSRRRSHRTPSRRPRQLVHLAQWECRAMSSQNGQPARKGGNRAHGCPARSPRSRPAREGPKVGAFFDLDGTLVAGFTGVIMTQDRLRRGQMSVGEFIGMVQAGLNHQLGRSEFEDLIGKGARMLHGNSLSDLDELGERLFVQHDPEAHLPRDARAGARPHGPRAHRRAELVGADRSGRTGGPVPRHRQRAEQQVRDRRRRADHRRGAHGRSSGGPARRAPCRPSPPRTVSTWPRATSTPTATRTSR